LVITLSSGAVGNELGALLGGDADHFLGNARTSDGGAEQVSGFINGVEFDSLKHIVLNKVGPEIRDDALESAARHGLGLDGLEILLELTNVGTEGDHIETFLAEPLENDRGIKTSRVSKNDLRLGVAHVHVVVLLLGFASEKSELLDCVFSFKAKNANAEKIAFPAVERYGKIGGCGSLTCDVSEGIFHVSSLPHIEIYTNKESIWKESFKN
jgi:hypothetical protein